MLVNRKSSIVLLDLMLLLATLVFPVAIYGMANTITLNNSGKISYIPPLHVDGRYVKDPANQTVLLRGVWKAEFADSCVGWWGGANAYVWNETAVRSDMQNLRDVWHANVFNTFIWGDWWLQDKAVTLGGYTTDHHYRWSIKETLRIAQEYGLYFQLRLYSPLSSQGRVDAPYQPYSNWTVANFVDFWRSVATELKDYSNVIFTLYDEPAGNQTTYFDAATQAINAIRGVGAEQLIVVHWAACGSCFWIGNWIDAGRPTHNIVFSNHIYRFHGTFAYNSSSSTDINYIRNFLAYGAPEPAYTGAGYLNMTEKYNVPIWVSAIGSNHGATDDAEYTYFANTLAVLNEWDLGYVAYQYFRTDTVWTVGYRTPNRVGQALINAITS